MPTYIYKCRDCGHRFEVQQSIKDKPLLACPKHNGDGPRCRGPIERVPGTPLVNLTGTGWHNDQYGKYGPKRSDNT